jgi:hypothetical protein
MYPFRCESRAMARASPGQCRRRAGEGAPGGGNLFCGRCLCVWLWTAQPSVRHRCLDPTASGRRRLPVETRSRRPPSMSQIGHQNFCFREVETGIRPQAPDVPDTLVEFPVQKASCANPHPGRPGPGFQRFAGGSSWVFRPDNRKMKKDEHAPMQGVTRGFVSVQVCVAAPLTSVSAAATASSSAPKISPPRSTFSLNQSIDRCGGFPEGGLLSGVGT